MTKPVAGHRQCEDCPAVFKATGTKKRCGPCSDVVFEKRHREVKRKPRGWSAERAQAD